MRKRGRHLRIACIAVPQRLQAGIGSLAGLLELATQFRGTRCIVAGIFSLVVIALIPLHLEGHHVGGQVGRRRGLGWAATPRILSTAGWRVSDSPRFDMWRSGKQVRHGIQISDSCCSSRDPGIRSCCTSRSGTNAGLWAPRPQRLSTIDLPQTYKSCRMVDVIPALPPVVSHWHLVRQLRPTLDAADGRPPARLRELHTRRESADGLIEGPENQKPRKSLNLRGFAIISGGERGIRTPDRRLTYTRFPGVRLKPLIHLSSKSESIADSNGGSPAPPKRQFIAATL